MNKKLPQELLDVLEAAQAKFSVASWEMADLLSDLETEFGEPLPRGKVADALGTLPSQVSSLILTAQRITKQMRDKYDGLPFSSFQFAARDEYPAEVLRLAVESADDYGGKPGGVRVVRAFVRARKGGDKGKNKLRTWSGHITYIAHTCYVLLDITDGHKPADGSAGTWRETP